MSFYINFICRINPCNPNFLLDRAQETILAGDIGGTNTRFTLYQVNRDDPEVKKGLSPGALAPGSKLFEMKYLNHEYPSFVDVLQKFLLEAKVKKPPVTACFAVAGPVSDNKVIFTNRASWSIDGALIETELGIQKVRLINDFLAVGYGLLTLDEEVECICLQVSQIPYCLGVLLYSALTLLSLCHVSHSVASVISVAQSHVSEQELASGNASLPLIMMGRIYASRLREGMQILRLEGQ